MTRDLSHSAAAPTVVVARKVLPGNEENFRAWDRRIRAAAAAHAGFLGSEVQEPNPSHPGEWVTMYSFATIDQLDAWLQSEDRKTLIAEVQELIDGPGREQRVAGLRNAPEPVTVVFSQRIAPHNEAEFVEMHEDVMNRLRNFDGFLGSDLLRPVEGVQDEHVIVASFASRHDLDEWLQSTSRRAWLEKAEELIEGERTVNVVGGFGGWFPAAANLRSGPKRWKQALAVLLALYPTSLLITAIRSEVAPDMHLVLAVYSANVLGVAALSFVLMPLVTKWLAGWLSR